MRERERAQTQWNGRTWLRNCGRGELCSALEYKELHPGALLLKAGQKPTAMALVLSGELAVHKTKTALGDEEEAVLNELGMDLRAPEDWRWWGDCQSLVLPGICVNEVSVSQGHGQPCPTTTTALVRTFPLHSHARSRCRESSSDLKNNRDPKRRSSSTENDRSHQMSKLRPSSAPNDPSLASKRGPGYLTTLRDRRLFPKKRSHDARCTTRAARCCCRAPWA